MVLKSQGSWCPCRDYRTHFNETAQEIPIYPTVCETEDFLEAGSDRRALPHSKDRHINTISIFTSWDGFGLEKCNLTFPDVDSVFRNQEFAFMYINNFLVAGTDEDKNVIPTFQWHPGYDISANTFKCIIGVLSVVLLDYQVGGEVNRSLRRTVIFGYQSHNLPSFRTPAGVINYHYNKKANRWFTRLLRNKISFTS